MQTAISCNDASFNSLGFSNLDLVTVATRALRITNVLTDTDIIQDEQRLYPELTFTSDRVTGIQYLLYASANTMATGSECSSSDFTLQAWRRDEDSGDFTQTGDIDMEPCTSFVFMFGKVCCEFRDVPEDIEGDVLGIMYGGSTSLLHEVRTGSPQTGETIDLTQGDYPLLSIDSGKLDQVTHTRHPAP